MVGAVAVHTPRVVALQALVAAQALAQETRQVQEHPRQSQTVDQAAAAEANQPLLAAQAQVESSR